MKKQKLYVLGKSFGLNKYELDTLFKSSSRYYTLDQPRISVMYSDQYKAGTHYGTISIKDF